MQFRQGLPVCSHQSGDPGKSTMTEHVGGLPQSVLYYGSTVHILCAFCCLGFIVAFHCSDLHFACPHLVSF